MTATDGSYSGPSHETGTRLIGEEWIEHGYKINPIFEEVEPCPICDAPNQTCSIHTVFDPAAEGEFNNGTS